MKGKNIILIGVGAIVGFISGGVFAIKKILENDRTRDALRQTISEKVERILFGDKPQSKSHSRVSYRSYYDFKSNRPKTPDSYSNIHFPSRVDAENVLDGMKDIIDQYGFVTIADFYDLCGICKFTYKSSQYGWVDTDRCKIVRIKDGFKIDLPDPLPIN